MATTVSQTLRSDIFITDNIPDSVWTTEEIQEVVSNFIRHQTSYGRRNSKMVMREDFFEGRHWAAVSEDDDSEAYRLVLNYCRRVVLGRVAGLAKAPSPRINVLAGRLEVETEQATKKERLLWSLWPDLMSAWRNVEMNSAKLGFGVLQVLWIDSSGGMTPEGTTYRKKVSQPHFKFRSISPYNFFPIYRSFDNPSDFMGVYRYDPGRNIADLNQRFKVSLQEASTLSLGQQVGYDVEVVGVDPAADLIEFWTENRYILIARTSIMVNPTVSTKRRNRNQGIDIIDGYVVLSSGENPFETIPFWVVPNIWSDPNRNPTSDGVISDIDDIAFMNQQYNHITSEEAEEIAVGIHRPVVYKSDEHQQDPSDLVYGPGEVWPIGEDEDIAVLPTPDEISAVDRHLGRMLKGIEDISFMGSTGFGRTDRDVTGVAANIALTPSQQYYELKIPWRKDALVRTCEFILRVFEKQAGNKVFKQWFKDRDGRFGTESIRKEDIGGDYHVDIIYGNLLPRDDHAFDQNEIYRFKTETQSVWTTLDRMGHADPAMEIKRMKEELNDPELNPEKVILIAQAKQVSGNAEQNQAAEQLGGPTPETGQQGGLPQAQGGEGIQNQAPPVPGSPEFPGQASEGGTGPGRVAPFLGREQAPNFNTAAQGNPGSASLPPRQEAPGRTTQNTLRKRS